MPKRSSCPCSLIEPERLSTSTDPSSTVCVAWLEAIMPTMLINPNIPATMKKTIMPTTVAATYLKNSFIPMCVLVVCKDTINY